MPGAQMGTFCVFTFLAVMVVAAWLIAQEFGRQEQQQRPPQKPQPRPQELLSQEQQQTLPASELQSQEPGQLPPKELVLLIHGTELSQDSQPRETCWWNPEHPFCADLAKRLGNGFEVSGWN